MKMYKNENVLFNLFIFNEMVTVYFSFFYQVYGFIFCILKKIFRSPVALCVVFV